MGTSRNYFMNCMASAMNSEVIICLAGGAGAGTASNELFGCTKEWIALLLGMRIEEDDDGI